MTLRKTLRLAFVAAMFTAGCGGGGSGGDPPTPRDAGADGLMRDARVPHDLGPVRADAATDAASGTDARTADARADSDAASTADARPASDAVPTPPDAAPIVDFDYPPDVPDYGDVSRPAPWPDPGPRPAACDAAPPLPVVPRVLFEASLPADYGPADAVYDAAGRLVVVTRSGDVYRIAPDGTRTLWAAHVVKTPRGVVFLSTGELVIADSGRGLLVALYPGGEVRTVFRNLDAPLGLEVDARDFLYVSEATRGAVRRIDPLTRRSEALADALPFAPGALAFSPDQNTLYVAASGSGALFALDRNADGTFGALRPFARLDVARDPCNDGLPGAPCGNGGTCRIDTAGGLVCLPSGQCLPEDVGRPCGTGGTCVSDGAGGALCSGDAACQDRSPGDLCVNFGLPGLCSDNGAGGLACNPPPCIFRRAGDVCADVNGVSGRCTDNLRGRLYCQTGDACAGGLEGAPCRDPALNAPGTCSRSGLGLYCSPEEPCDGLPAGSRCTLPGLGGAAACDLDPTSGLSWCRAPVQAECAGRFDGAPCATEAGTSGTCFNTSLEWLCVDPNPCVVLGQGCVTDTSEVGRCISNPGGALVCRAVACQGNDGAGCVDLDGTPGHCAGDVCVPESVCDAADDGAPCHSPRTRGAGLCGPGAGATRVCQPLNPCAGLANGAECTIRPGLDGQCVVSENGGAPDCDTGGGNASVRALETDACGNVYASDDTTEGLWRISPDGQTVTRAASLMRHPITSLVWAPAPDAHTDSTVLHAVGLGGADLIAVPLGVPARRTVVPLDDTVRPHTRPDAQAAACLDLPDAPLSITPIPRARGYHDVALDSTGHVIGFDGGALVQVDYRGNGQLFAAGIQGVEGMDWLPDGSLVAATSAGLVRIFPNGAQVVIAPDIYAYGVTVGPDGLVYAADNSARIWRVDADAQTATLYWTNENSTAFAPRTISFDPDRSLMYIGAFGDKVFSMPIGPDLAPLAAPRRLVTVWPGAAFLDGLAVDACGNLYMPNYESSTLYRIAPDGDVIPYHVWDRTQYGHGLEWGSGVGGFRSDALYFAQPYNGSSVLEVVTGGVGRPEP